jgi:hypothetical protein
MPHILPVGRLVSSIIFVGKCGNKQFAEFLAKNIPYYYRIVNYLDLVPDLLIGTESFPNTSMNYFHAGQMHWLNYQGILHDSEKYQKKMQKLDQFGRAEVRYNLVNYLRHTGDHSMVNYYYKIFGLMKNENKNVFLHSEFLKKQFNQSKSLADENDSSNLNTYI